MKSLRRMWHWIDGPLPKPRLDDRRPGETNASWEERRTKFLAESDAYQKQNWRLIDRNIRAAIVLVIVAGIIQAVVVIARAVR